MVDGRRPPAADLIAVTPKVRHLSSSPRKRRAERGRRPRLTRAEPEATDTQLPGRLLCSLVVPLGWRRAGRNTRDASEGPQVESPITQLEARRLRPGDPVLDGEGLSRVARVHGKASGDLVVTLVDGRELVLAPSDRVTVAWVP